MSDTTAAQASAASSSALSIRADLACTACGYNLRGLSAAGVCPECGLPVGRSARGDLLRFAPPTWVDGLRRGAKLMLWYIGLCIALAFVGGLVGGLPAAVGLGQGSAPMSVITGYATSAGFLVNALLHPTGWRPTSAITVSAVLAVQAVFLAGVWLLTRPEPRSGQGGDLPTLRALVRWSAVMGVAGGAMINSAPAAVAVTTTVAVGGVLSLLGVVGAFGLFVYLRRFALRLPDIGLARQACIVMWGLVVSYGLMQLAGVAVLLLAFAGLVSQTGVPSGSSGAFVAGMAAFAGIRAGVLAALVFDIWTVVLLVRYHHAFAQAHALAQQAWADAA